jgi:hypothetical protein
LKKGSKHGNASWLPLTNPAVIIKPRVTGTKRESRQHTALLHSSAVLLFLCIMPVCHQCSQLIQLGTI